MFDLNFFPFFWQKEENRTERVVCRIENIKEKSVIVSIASWSMDEYIEISKNRFPDEVQVSQLSKNDCFFADVNLDANKKSDLNLKNISIPEGIKRKIID